MLTRSENKKRYLGFSLIEILIVIAIIGILSAIIIPALNLVREKSKKTEVQNVLRQLRTSVSLLEDDSAEWPGNRQPNVVDTVEGNEIWDLNDPNAGIIATNGTFPNWAGPYMSIGSVKVDPWGNNYFFDPYYNLDPVGPGRWAVVIGSFGPNGVGQNVYDDDNMIEILASE
ncbi:MAG: hypothetical protein COU83_02230 [Candidatus Portnoybacteria bacterium CG10_big_fil_rev_8_21_14_0_10_40_22]|uniref:Type II secretion system protein GspG C-terminal domain-containing protein n=1 Tax=Candidatus Portnoybacteria bacterium CG10_big_fil_rev_8_21_14_0_10_40_22 TaxID=1974814 RepID=A0A2M8KFP8_9BACT|nr:MAG: hypothetical protein COU83_02230 [Candidatus Portnoybacteria bacterium CG10_big_fil_rev_8_21_14_0_10_40_22]